MKIKWNLVVLNIGEPNMFINPYKNCSVRSFSDMTQTIIGEAILFNITYRKTFNYFKQFNKLIKNIELKEDELYNSNAWKNVETAKKQLTKWYSEIS